MKKIFSIFAVICCFAAACDKYDDSELKEALSSLEGRVEALESLNGELAALKAIVEGKITVASCVENDGVWTVTLSDGKSFNVYPQAEETLNVPVVTVIEEGGKSYWGYYENGEVTYLLQGDKKIEVTSVVPSVRINEENHIEISVDGGKTWTESKEELLSGACVFSAVEKKEDSIVFTLADGFTQYMVQLQKDIYQQFMSLSGKQFFTNGETKNISIEMVGVENFTITERPEGWKTVLTEGQLTVTAPAKGVGDTEGYIKMIGVGTETSIASVYVTIGTAPCVISISDTKNVTIKAETGSFFYGASTMDAFDPAALAKELGEVTNFMLSRHPYASELDAPLENLVAEVVPGEIYVVWALPITGAEYTKEDVLYQAVSSVGVTYEVSGVTFDDANMYVNVSGTDTYYLIPMSEDMTVDTCIEDLGGSYAATYNEYKHDSSYMGKLSELVSSPIAGVSYEFLVLPVKSGEYLKADAKTFAVKLSDYARGGNLNVSLTERVREYKSLTVNVSADASAYRCFVAAVPKSDYVSKNYDDDAALLDYLSSLAGVSYSSSYDFVAKNLESGTDYYIVAAAVDRKGVLGTPARLQLSTEKVVPSDEVISIAEVNVTTDAATILLAENSKIVRYRYMFMAGNGSDYWYNTYIDNDAAAYDAIVYGTCDYVDMTAAQVSGGISFTDLQLGVNYIFRMVGYDDQGRVTALVKKDITTTVGVVVKSTEEKWSEMMPDVNITVSGTSMRLSVNFPQGCKSYVITKMSSEEYEYTCPSAARQKIDYMLDHYYALTFTDGINNYKPAEWYITADRPYVLIAWEDDSNWYEPLVIDSKTGERVN